MSSPPAKETHRETGRVVRLEGALAVVSVPKAGACEGCAARGVCHSLSGTDDRELRAVNRIEAAPGDTVELAIPSREGLRAAFWVYLLPTLLMLGVALGAHWLLRDRLTAEGADLAAAGAALGALALFALGAFAWRRQRGPDLARYPVVVRRL